VLHGNCNQLLDLLRQVQRTNAPTQTDIQPFLPLLTRRLAPQRPQEQFLTLDQGFWSISLGFSTSLCVAKQRWLGEQCLSPYIFQAAMKRSTSICMGTRSCAGDCSGVVPPASGYDTLISQALRGRKQHKSTACLANSSCVYTACCISCSCAREVAMIVNKLTRTIQSTPAEALP
jgi:hypothetical protein